jgi:hypothetical protein
MHIIHLFIVKGQPLDERFSREISKMPLCSKVLKTVRCCHLNEVSRHKKLGAGNIFFHIYSAEIAGPFVNILKESKIDCFELREVICRGKGFSRSCVARANERSASAAARLAFVSAPTRLRRTLVPGIRYGSTNSAESIPRTNSINELIRIDGASDARISVGASGFGHKKPLDFAAVNRGFYELCADFCDGHSLLL